MTPDDDRTWVFLSHTLDQVGPPVFLLELLRWLRLHTDVRAEVVSLRDGSLRPEFEVVAGVHVVGEPDPVRPGRVLSHGATALRDQLRRWPLRHLDAPSLVYVNTAWSIRARRYLPPTDAPLVTHVHELEVGLSLHLDAAERSKMFADSVGLVAASDAVADNLARNHGVDRAEVAVHHEMITIDDRPPKTSIADLRAELGIGPDAHIVGTAAVVNWRKGSDLFVQLATRLRNSRPDLDVHLVWIGGRRGEPDTMRLRADAAAARVADRLHLVEFVDRPLDWMRAFEVFVLTAREDAFPLACLEAASTGCPIVCFDSGGMPEFVESDAGVVIPYAKIGEMVDRIAALLDDPAEAVRLGRRAATKVRERHDAAAQAPLLYADLCRWEGR